MLGQSVEEKGERIIERIVNERSERIENGGERGRGEDRIWEMESCREKSH